MEVSGQIHARPLYPQGNSPWYPLYRRLGAPQNRSGRGDEKNSKPPPGIVSYNPDRPARSLALYRLSYLLLLSLAPQPSLGHGLLHKIRLNFLEASQKFSFLQGRVVSPTPNPHPGGPGLRTYIPQSFHGSKFTAAHL
jgi:hypothetical protein